MPDYIRVRKFDYGPHLPLDRWMRNQRLRVSRALQAMEAKRVKAPVEHGASRGDFELTVRDQFGSKTVAFEGPIIGAKDALLGD